MPLQEFKNVRAKGPEHKPWISVLRKGRVSLNAVALDDLGNPTHVVLLFDPETREFGVRAAKPEEMHAYKLRKETEGTAESASVLALWSYYDIDVDRYVGRYPAKKTNNILVISLSEKGAEEV
ncbi:MAG: hypothetical protein M3Y58_23410 [Chloroflexota bacterium]|nr:hypothetical protein [Chloroflexota bacterium]